MKTVLFAYRRKADGRLYLHGQRPYCTKAAAKNGLHTKAALRYAPVVEGERRRYRTTGELAAVVAADYELVIYELREVTP